jgi:hypothetical protein
MANVDLIKETYGLNTYTKAINTSFSELISPSVEVSSSAVTVDDFFTYYDELFFNIPVDGTINSHKYLVLF